MAQCVFPASVILNITNQSLHHLSVIFLMMCTFVAYGYLISCIYLLAADI